MASRQRFRLAAAFGVAVLVLSTMPGGAQAPPGPSGEASQAAACLCERQQIAVLGGEMDEKKRSLEQIRHELADLDAQLERARPTVDVNNPESVERYKALLARHDAAYQRSVGPVVGETVAAVNRYNDRVNAYNQGCAHRLFDARVMAQVRATLSCPGPR